MSENENIDSENETISSISSNDDSEDSEDSEDLSSDDFENNFFECPKCGYEYISFNESNYHGCIECANNYCKNCSNFCDKCQKEICFRCSFYTQCCNKNRCISCTWHCEECYDNKCNICESRNECINCEMWFCKNHISPDHKINVCMECCDDFCNICSELTYENPCTECFKELEEIIDNFKLPYEINKHIISYL